MSFAITQQDQVLHIKLSGHVNNDELLKLDKALFEKWESPEIKGHIYDYLDTESFNFSEDEIKSIAVIDTNESFITGHVKIAIVATNPDILHFSKIYQQNMRSSDWEVSIFDNVNEGIAYCRS